MQSERISAPHASLTAGDGEFAIATCGHMPTTPATTNRMKSDALSCIRNRLIATSKVYASTCARSLYYFVTVAWRIHEVRSAQPLL